MTQEDARKPYNHVAEDRHFARVAGSATKILERRLLSENGTFMLPFLQPGMRLLDCGCGPGAMTIEIAEHIAPGEVVGIDIADEQIARARQLAAERSASNIRFERANVYQLPFSNHTFDAVFSHALLEHVQDPLAALREMRRVLKPGGMVMVRIPDWDGNLTWPFDPDVERSTKIVEALFTSTGGNPYVGKQLRGLLHQTEFEHIQTSASYTSYGTPAAMEEWQQNAEAFTTSPIADYIIQRGIADVDTLAKVLSACREWAARPDAFQARAWCEAVAWVPMS
jgi:ubiquinone/menaquinone biosynthesis C-methylase UbiE